MIIERIIVGKYAVNSYLIVDETTKDAAIIDPGEQGNLIERALDEHGATLKYILLTHGHGDHIGAVLPLKAKTGAKVIASEDEYDLLMDASKNESARICSEPIVIDADLYVRDQEKIALGGLTLTCIKTPGHTKGGLCFKLEDHLFTGDTLFRRSVGRADLYGGDFVELINSITSKLFVLEDHIHVYPGHGPQSTIGEERRENPFI